jgi:hypothetical protein
MTSNRDAKAEERVSGAEVASDRRRWPSIVIVGGAVGASQKSHFEWSGDVLEIAR